MDLDRIRQEAETPSVAGPGDSDAVADDLADAFTDDVMFDWFLRNDARRADGRTRFFRHIIRHMSQGARIDRPASGGAAAVWMPFEAVGPTPLRDMIRAAPTILAATGFGRIGRLLAVMDDMEKHHPMDRPHAYLWFLGVRHAAQGRGVGSRLLASATARLDASETPAYLETQTERNLALYRRHGFEVISEHRPRPDAPMLWSMWREPRPLED
ncbi:MAG: GNAT family N-acetyltransferase [Alphaproteobacteria bacterium]|jgi:ribosomal protein S18 acetylase RimI-like enzyme|nr:GNAT family N-acetyltransferase [Alphaproteobacteria bacterium]